EHAMKGFRSAGGAQRFLSAFSGISPHFRPHRHLMSAPDHRAEMTIRFAIWDQITGAADQPATDWPQAPTANPSRPDTPSGIGPATT
ncbi:hypothetical protein AB0H11_52760, partial [Streptomyces mirabilis]